jgi:SAM-dependent methyltransferase
MLSRSISLAIRRWRQYLANRGFLATGIALSQGAWRSVFRNANQARQISSELWRNADATPLTTHPFDERYGTDTSGLIWGEDLACGHPHDAWNTAYYGIAPSLFEAALHLLVERAGIDLSQFTFIDLGSGKGRAVLLAAMHPFTRTVGVELSPELHAIARANLERFPVDLRRCNTIYFMNADAADFPWESSFAEDSQTPFSGPLLFFLYNPFARPVLTSFLNRLDASLRSEARAIYLLCVNPELDAVLTSQRWLKKQWQETMTIGEGDRLADRFGSTTETVAVYCSR